MNKQMDSPRVLGRLSLYIVKSMLRKKCQFNAKVVRVVGTPALAMAVLRARTLP